MVDATVHLIERGHVRTDVNHVVEGATVATAAEPEPTPVRGEGPVYNVVIDHPEATILWDTGSHPDAGAGHWPTDLYDEFEAYDADEHRLDDGLEAAGFGIADVDAVIASHLHVDHAGGLRHFAGTAVPIYVHAEELEHAYLAAKTGAGGDLYVAGDFDHDLAWRPVRGRRLTPVEGVELVHLPGHTPGLLGVLLHLDAGSHFLVGDQADVRANWAGAPLGAKLLWDRPAWQASLEWARDLARRHDATVYCGHDADDVEALRGGLP